MWIDNKEPKYDSIISKNGDCFYFEKFQSMHCTNATFNIKNILNLSHTFNLEYINASEHKIENTCLTFKIMSLSLRKKTTALREFPLFVPFYIPKHVYVTSI